MNTQQDDRVRLCQEPYECALQARAQDTLREKLVTIVETYDETSREIQSTLAQMEEAFELLMPKPDQAQRGKQGLAAQDEDDLEWEDVAGDAADGTYINLYTLSCILAEQQAIIRGPRRPRASSLCTAGDLEMMWPGA